MRDTSGTVVGQWTYDGGSVTSLAGDVTIYDTAATLPTNEVCAAPISGGYSAWSADPASGASD
jgi:hypothetical protein